LKEEKRLEELKSENVIGFEYIPTNFKVSQAENTRDFL
jgi:hypothetical protein